MTLFPLLQKITKRDQKAFECEREKYFPGWRRRKKSFHFSEIFQKNIGSRRGREKNKIFFILERKKKLAHAPREKKRGKSLLFAILRSWFLKHLTCHIAPFCLINNYRSYILAHTSKTFQKSSPDLFYIYMKGKFFWAKNKKKRKMTGK